MTPEAVQVMAAGYIRAWLDGDFWTCARVAAAIEDAAVPAAAVAEVFSLLAASMLTDACDGSSARAARVAAARAAAETARQARLLSARR